MTKLKLLAASSALAVSLVVASCGSSGSSQGAAPPTPTSSSAPSASSAATASTGAHNDADVTFASSMIPHHRQAIEMADMILGKDGIDAKVTDLATRIKAAQTPEITQMSGWLSAWGADPSLSSAGGMGGMGGMGDGMMNQADMDALGSATGAQAAKLFLTGMVKHHQGAVAMAQTELDQGQNAEAKTLAQNIITSQQAEITEMNQLLGR